MIPAPWASWGPHSGLRAWHYGRVSPNEVSPPADDGPVRYLEVLRELHERLRPRTYLEIGVETGKSLTLAKCRSIGVDPDFSVVFELEGEISLHRTTSDEFFARPDPTAWLGRPVDLAFIDGMHRFEFALRDFINLEKHCTWSSVIVFDDMLPRSVDEAARNRHTSGWTGDVFRIMRVLRKYRPDLELILVNTRPTGLLLVLGLDPASTVLEDHYDEIVATTVKEDPQPVPRAIFDRKGARRAEAVLRSPVWGVIRRSRRLPVSARRGRAQLRAALANPRGFRRRRRALGRILRRAGR